MLLLGGFGGPLNAQAEALTARTELLKNRQFNSISEMLNSGETTPGGVYSTGGTVWKMTGTNGASLFHYTPMTVVNFLDYGVTADNAFDCAAAFATAKALGKPTRFSGGGFYLSGTKVDLSGFDIHMTGDSYFRANIEPGVIKNCRFVTDVRIKNDTFATDLIFPANVDAPFVLANSGAASSYVSDETFKLLDLNAAPAEKTDIASYNTRTAFSGVVVDNHVLAWPTPPTKESGYFIDTEAGDLVESTFVLFDSTAAGVAMVSVLTSTARYFFALTLGNTSVEYVKVNKDGSGGQIRTFTTDPNANFAIATGSGGVTAGVRITSHNTFEFYLSDTLIAKEQVEGYIQQVGYTLNPAATAKDVQIVKPILYKNKIPKGSKTLKILCIGDSQTAGVGNTMTWPQLLSSVGRNLHGLGEMKVTNIAVSGTTFKWWYDGPGASTDYTGYDYVLVMLGTNDVQGSTPVNTFGNYAQNLITKIKSQGAKPIVGIFPLWTDRANSGFGDPLAQNHYLAAKYRAELKQRCAVTGVPTANVLGYFGNNMIWMADNIHPNTEGSVAIAAAFAAALSTECGPAKKIGTNVKHIPPLQNGWANDPGTTYEPMSYVKDSSGLVTLSGNVRNGTALFSTITTLPIGYRPKSNVVAPCISNNNEFGAILVTESGLVQFTAGTLGGWWAFSISYFAGA